ncbi:hypothetical protein J0910_04950 [Nocardiopsis sp. CNT-189]|uniref:hypothetical protein n=1 Tax=Nocardiopsis oceanisediminis TaxID=2816862 RepID=UPI003B2C10D5
MNEIGPRTPAAVLEDVPAKTASLLPGEHMRPAENAPAPEAEEAAKAKTADARDSAYQNLDGEGLIAEIQRLRSLLDQLENGPEGR